MAADAFETINCTPSGLRILGTAKALAAPGKITPEHLLLAMEVNVSVARNVLCRLRLQPSEVLRFDLPADYRPIERLYCGDFVPEVLDAITKQVPAEAKALKSSYQGTDHLLLMLARIGVQTVPLDYAQVRQLVIDELNPQSARKAKA